MTTVSSWMSDKLSVANSATHGRGVFATKSIERYERLVIFGGDIMLIDEIMNLPEQLRSYPMQIEERFVLGRRDADEPEDTDFFNHSCDPNAGFKGQIFLVAMRQIERGEEVTFDYAMVLSESVGSEIGFEMTCNCRAATCRGMITEFDWRSPQLLSRYKGFFSQYLQDKIDQSHKNRRSGPTSRK